MVAYQLFTFSFVIVSFRGVQPILIIKRAKRFIKDFESQWAESTTNGDTSVVNRILANDFIGSDEQELFFFRYLNC